MSGRALQRSLRRFARLPSGKRALAVETALRLLLALLLTRFVPARYWWRFLDTAEAPPRGQEAVRRGACDSNASREVARAVEKVALHAPFRARCLQQAMAAQWMLRRRGVPSVLVFGVRRGADAERPLDFHAWLTVGGECVVGGREVGSFKAFPALGN